MRVAPAFAGQFYPDDPDELGAMLDDWFGVATVLSPPPEALLLPHAGYVYSGATSARAMGAAAGATPRTVVVGGPSHRVAVEGAVVFVAEAFETPFGPLPVDVDLAEALATSVEGLRAVDPFAEHSLEVQLPMIRRVWPQARVVAIAFGAGDLELASRLAGRIGEELDTGACLFVGSTDLSHYHGRERARTLDARFRELLTASDPERMFRGLRDGETEACGAGPVFTFMELARQRGGNIVVVDQRDSGDAFGESDRVVGYLSAASCPRPS